MSPLVRSLISLLLVRNIVHVRVGRCQQGICCAGRKLQIDEFGRLQGLQAHADGLFRLLSQTQTPNRLAQHPAVEVLERARSQGNNEIVVLPTLSDRSRKQSGLIGDVQQRKTRLQILTLAVQRR